MSFSFIPFLMSLALGAMIVLQGGVNRELIPLLTLKRAIFINATILFCVASLLLFFQSKETSSGTFSFSSFKLWYLVPGFCGLGIVFGVPIVISKWGSLNTFIVMVCAQLIASQIWDYYINGTEFTRYRIGGVILAVIGTFIAVFKR